METITLSSKGQLVIPKAIRDNAHIVAGAQFEVRYVEGEIRLRPLPTQGTTQLDEVAGCLAQPGRERLSDAKVQTVIRAKLKAKHTP